MSPAQIPYDALNLLITGVGIGCKVSVKSFQQAAGNVPTPRPGIIKVPTLELFAASAADHPDEGFTADFFTGFLIALDPGLIHVQVLALHLDLMDAVIDRLQPLFTAVDGPVGHVVAGKDKTQTGHREILYVAASYPCSTDFCLWQDHVTSENRKEDDFSEYRSRNT